MEEALHTPCRWKEERVTPSSFPAKACTLQSFLTGSLSHGLAVGRGDMCLVPMGPPIPLDNGRAIGMGSQATATSQWSGRGEKAHPTPTSTPPLWDIPGHNVMAQVPSGQGTRSAADVTLFQVRICLPRSPLDLSAYEASVRPLCSG